MPNPANSQCDACQSAFYCGHNSPQGCWCMSLPHVMPPTEGSSCLCPDCLYRRLQILLADQLPADKLEQLLSRKPQPEVDYYLNENAYWVFTAWYHLKRGSCCDNGCRHCPYPKSD